MTNETKTLIISLRESGKSYGDIATITGICESIVKTICLRYKKQNEDKNKCKYCSKKLKFIKGKKKKIFCSDNCRMLYWKENQKLIKRKPCFDVDFPWERISKAYTLKAKLNKHIKKQNIRHGGSSHYQFDS